MNRLRSRPAWITERKIPARWPCGLMVRRTVVRSLMFTFRCLRSIRVMSTFLNVNSESTGRIFESRSIVSAKPPSSVSIGSTLGWKKVSVTISRTSFSARSRREIAPASSSSSTNVSAVISIARFSISLSTTVSICELKISVLTPNDSSRCVWTRSQSAVTRTVYAGRSARNSSE